MADDIEEDTEIPAHTSYRAAVDAFIAERLQAKLDPLDADDPKRDELIERYERNNWLEAAAKRAKSISIATHLVKPINPRARGTNLLWMADPKRSLDVVGTHNLKGPINPDVTGNAAEFDVYALLCLQVAEKSLLTALMDGDPDALSTLHEDTERASLLAQQFVAIAVPETDNASSHPLAKQIYWLTGDDASDDRGFHLLAPLYSSPLAQVVYDQIQLDRFGEIQKEIREAFQKRKTADGIHRVYPALAVQKLGGTKPQTVSRHNLNRRGTNYLLSSLPPSWKSSEFRIPAHTDSVFDRIYGARMEVRRTVRQLRKLLESDPAQTMETRDRVEALVERLIDEAVIMAGGFQRALPAGWSLDEDCRELHRDEQLWLDPMRAEMSVEADFAAEWLWMDWPAAIGKRFAQWLNAQLDGKHVFGDAEQRQWKKLLLVDESTDGWAQQLHRLRKQLDGPRYIPTRQTHDELVAGEVSS